MSYLARLTARPLGAWPWPERSYKEQRRGRFKVMWEQSVAELQREIGLLGCTQAVLEVDVAGSRDIGRDGFVLVGAKVKSSRVVLRFNLEGQGALVYKCDFYDHWQDNVRAICMTLEALRAIDRHGVTSRQEQFAGFEELPSTTGPTMTTTRAAELVGGSTDRNVVESMMKDPEAARAAVRVAVKKAHPDTGGTPDAFNALQTARKVLSVHHGVSI